MVELKVRYSLRFLLLVFAIAPLASAWMFAPYFRPSRGRTLLVSLNPTNFYTSSPTISYGVNCRGRRLTFVDGVPFGSLDYVTDDRTKHSRRFFSKELTGRVTHRPDQRTTQEMEQQFEAVQAFVRDSIGATERSAESYLRAHGNRIHRVLREGDLPEISCPR